MTDLESTPQPLIYPRISGQGIYTNVLLIDSQVIDYQKMVDSVNTSTFPIVYSICSQKSELLSLLQANFTTIERIGLAFISSLEKPKFFLDKKPLFIENETQPYSENLQFILDIITQFQVKNVDYLACDTLNYSNWNVYYNLLKQNTTAVIGASSDKTGNIQYGGDWVLENTSEDIELIYFTSAIQYYAFLLDNPSWATSASGLNYPALITIDPTNTYAYVYNNFIKSVSRISISNPTNYVANWLVDISNSYTIITDFVIDSTNTYMYLSCTLGQLVAVYYIYKIPLNNPSGYTIFKTVSLPSHITIDSTNTYLYIGRRLGDVISRISLSDPNGDYTPNWATSAQGLISITALNIDPINAYIYANNKTVVNSVSTDIKTKISITNPTTDYTAAWRTSVLSENDFAIDSQNTYMYVVNGNPYNNVTQISISDPSNSIIYANASQGLYTPNSIALDPSNTYMYVINYTGGGDSLGTISQISLPSQPSPNTENNPCFLHDTKILTDKGYVKIQSLRKGDRIQTLNHGFVPIDMIGFKHMYHPAQKERIADQLYKYSSATHPEIFEDLVITGCHSILIEEFTDSKQRDKTNEVLGDIFITDNKYRLPACVDENSKIYETPGKYTIYHLALENHDYYMNYGVFANGLLVETTSKRYMKELSNMTLFP